MANDADGLCIARQRQRWRPRERLVVSFDRFRTCPKFGYMAASRINHLDATGSVYVRSKQDLVRGRQPGQPASGCLHPRRDIAWRAPFAGYDKDVTGWDHGIAHKPADECDKLSVR
jgi:hypothetical protein